MPKPLEDTIKPDAGEVSAEDESLNGLNSPQLDPETGKPKNRAVSSFKQAASISKRQYDNAEERLGTAATISDKYAGTPPYKQAHLKSTGQGWRSNYSTNPLASKVDRATPQIKDPIKQADSLTFSSLPSQREGAADKTRKFQDRTSRLFRAWPGWEDFIDIIAQDNYLYGNSAPGWIDDDWRPRAFRQDEAFLPDGTGQHASSTQFIVYRQPILLHDFLKKIEDKEIAVSAGFDWDGCIKAANEAGGLRNSGGSQTDFERVDAMREGGSIDKTYDGETKIVWLFHLLVREYDGGVNLWTTAQKGGHAVRFQEGIHKSMEDACTLFTIQSGNNHFYGSKGAGRMLTNMHIALDRFRNFCADKAYVAGLPIFKVKGKDVNGVQMHFRAPFMFITGDAEMLQEQVTFDAQTAEYQDNKMNQQMEEIAGGFVPSAEQEAGTPSTKIADAERIKRQLAVKSGVLGRFFRQFGDLVGAMQRKVYSSDNLKEGLRIFEESKVKEQKGIRVLAAKLWNWIKDVIPNFDKQASPMDESKDADADAVEAIVDLLREGLSIEDIAELALAPTANRSDEQPEVRDGKVTDLIGAVTQNLQLAPYFDHRKMASRLAKIQGGEDIAEEFMLKDKPDPSDQAINAREELSEWLTMMQGDPVGAAATDNHRIRRAVLATKLKPIIDTMMQAPTPEMVKFATLAVPHYGQHLQMDQETPPEQLQGEIASFQQMEQVVMDAQKHLEDLAKQAAAAGVPGGDPNGLPPPMPGQPPGNMVDPTEEAKLHAETERTAADIFMRNKELELGHRKLDIEEKKLGQQDEHHTQDRALDVAGAVADKAAQAQDQGEAAAQSDLQMQQASQEIQQSQDQADALLQHQAEQAEMDRQAQAEQAKQAAAVAKHAAKHASKPDKK